MQEMVVKKNNFQIDAFMDSILSYMGSQMGGGLNPLDAVMIFPQKGASGFIGVDCADKSDLLNKLMDGNTLYLVFRAPDFGRQKECADGRVHKKVGEADKLIDGESTLGFLIKMENDCFYISSAVASSDDGGNWLSASDSNLFDKPMTRYIKRFINK